MKSPASTPTASCLRFLLLWISLLVTSPTWSAPPPPVAAEERAQRASEMQKLMPAQTFQAFSASPGFESVLAWNRNLYDAFAIILEEINNPQTAMTWVSTLGDATPQAIQKGLHRTIDIHRTNPAFVRRMAEIGTKEQVKALLESTPEQQQPLTEASVEQLTQLADLPREQRNQILRVLPLLHPQNRPQLLNPKAEYGKNLAFLLQNETKAKALEPDAQASLLQAMDNSASLQKVGALFKSVGNPLLMEYLLAKQRGLLIGAAAALLFALLLLLSMFGRGDRD